MYYSSIKLSPISFTQKQKSLNFENQNSGCQFLNLRSVYAEQVTQPSSIEQLGPAGISSDICSTTSGITGSMFLPPWFSTVNLTACDAAWVRK